MSKYGSKNIFPIPSKDIDDPPISLDDVECGVVCHVEQTSHTLIGAWMNRGLFPDKVDIHIRPVNSLN